MSRDIFVRNETLKYEMEIIWLEDPSKLDWVREIEAEVCTRKGMAQAEQRWIEEAELSKIVGYANLDDNAPCRGYRDDGTPYFFRRVFTLFPEDRPDNREYKWGKTSFPSEAVDPLTVTPKALGVYPYKRSQIAVRLPLSLHEKLNRHVKQTGISKTEVVVSALANYLDSAEEVPLIHRIVELEKRVTALEAGAGS